MTELFAAEPGTEFEQRDWLTRGLEQLPSEQRASLELAYQLGYSCKEIAQIMDCGIPAVKSRMMRGRDSLRASLPLLAGNAKTARDSISNFLTAAFAGLAIGWLIWQAASGTHGRLTSDEGVYRTVTSAASVRAGTTVRAIFASSLTATERDVLLESAGLHIVSGPTAAGVYSLGPVAGADHRANDAALLQLRAHPSVIFAEPVADSRHH